jgi:hypothetical protein
MLKYAFAHHPTCNLFKNHVYNIKNIWICKGCAVTYPLSIITFVIAFIVHLELSTALTVTLIMFCISIVTTLGIIPSKLAFIKRIILGLFSGLYFYCFVINGRLEIFVIGLILFYFIFLFFIIIRYINLTKTCQNCIYEGDWEKCEGFFELKKELFKNTIWESDYLIPPESGKIKGE